MKAKPQCLQRNLLAAGLAMLLVACAGPGAKTAGGDSKRLLAPAGYSLPAVEQQAFKGCPKPSAPVTGALDYPSKFQGSDAARDDLNRRAEAEYRQRTRPITALEKGINRLAEDYLRSGDIAAVDCAVAWLEQWAEADAMLGPATTHTGKSMRKWALGSVSAAYLRLQRSASAPLATHATRARQIEHWLGKWSEQVVAEWSDVEDQKFNNHEYWAAWAVMVTAVVTDDHDQFHWAIQMYRRAVSQVSAEGYLENELRRDTRALYYHNYALPPLAMIAAFAHANGVWLLDEANGGLGRLAENVIAGINEPRRFRQKTGSKQKPKRYSDSKFTWLEPYCSLVTCRGALAEKLQASRPLENYRVGGDLTQLFGTSHKRAVPEST